MVKRKRRKFTDQQKTDAVRLVRQVGSVGQVARDLDLTETALRRWVKQAEIDEGHGPEGALTTEEKEELRQLRREVRTLRMERDFLKNFRARGRLLLEAETPLGSVAPSERSGRQLTGAFEPVKKHGPGAAADLQVVTPRRGDPV